MLDGFKGVFTFICPTKCICTLECNEEGINFVSETCFKSAPRQLIDQLDVAFPSCWWE